jgi:hypothetical protein
MFGYIQPQEFIRCVRKIEISEYKFRHVRLSVYLSAGNNLAPTGRILIKSDI